MTEADLLPLSQPEQPPAPILSLDEFFDATGTGFMKDVLGMTGVDLGSKRRRSMAPSASGRTRECFLSQRSGALIDPADEQRAALLLSPISPSLEAASLFSTNCTRATTFVCRRRSPTS